MTKTMHFKQTNKPELSLQECRKRVITEPPGMKRIRNRGTTLTGGNLDDCDFEATQIHSDKNLSSCASARARVTAYEEQSLPVCNTGGHNLVQKRNQEAILHFYHSYTKPKCIK